MNRIEAFTGYMDGIGEKTYLCPKCQKVNMRRTIISGHLVPPQDIPPLYGEDICRCNIKEG
jgi:hypothetical protein